MKILSVGNFGHGWDGSICDEEHIAQALEQLGHEVVRSQRGGVNDYLSPNSSPYDFVLIAQWDGYHPDFIKNTRRELNEGKVEELCPVVYWAFDYQNDGQEWHEHLVKESDLYLSKRIADSKYPNWRWCSQDFAPEFLTKWEEPITVEKYEQPPFQKDIDVLFTGSYLSWATERNEIMELVASKYNLVIHSVNAWPQGNEGPVMDDALPALYARAKIVLSVDHTYEAGYWSDRNSQAIACGAFVLFRHVPLSEAIFRSNIAYFWGKEDVLDKIEYWLEHDEDREYIAAEAYDNSVYYKVRERVADMLNIVREIL